jgi:peptidoglycan hydrolase-like protein with peptidoglycan-binding domain
MPHEAALIERPKRDLGAVALWERSLARSLERRRSVAVGERAARSILSEALIDLDGPVSPRAFALHSGRDLSDPELWSLSLAIAQAKRRAARSGVLPQARVAGASLVVAAVAAALPSPGGAHGRIRSSGLVREHVSFLRVGSRGPEVVHIQRRLGIEVDGIFGPQTRAAVRAFQRAHQLEVDGVVGPRTRAVLFREGGTILHAWWVRPVQRALHVHVDGDYGPITRSAVRDFQRRHGLAVDGIVGPQTLEALGINRPRSSRGQHPHYIRAWWVVPVQEALHVDADGLYGPETRAAVRAFQRQHGLVVDGVVGPQTLAALGVRHHQGGNGEANTSIGHSHHATRGARAVRVAKRYLGVPYRWAGASPATGFDCSGFVMYVYGKVGVTLPHNAAMQYGYGHPVARADLRAGDIVFFDHLGHDGIYIGGGRFIHSPHTGDVVKISSLSGWYADTYVGGKRV